MNAVDTLPHHGELSLTVQHSISLIQFKGADSSNFNLKLDMHDLAELNDDELHIHSPQQHHRNLNRAQSTVSEIQTETSASSKSFTIETEAGDDDEEEEQKVNLRLTSMDMEITSPTCETHPGSSHCVTPRPGSMPLDPDQILHSL